MRKLLASLLFVGMAAVLLLQSGRLPLAQAERAKGPKQAAAQEKEQAPEQPAERPPDNGPRIDALKGWCELAGVRVRIKEVYVSRGYDDDVIRWGNVPTDMWMKVELEYKYLTKNSDATYYWWNRSTASHCAIYDDSNRKSNGVNGFSYNREETQKWLKQGMVRPTEETIYFAAPKRGSRYYDLDLVPDHLMPGEKYQFRIPNFMIDWRE